MKSLIDKLKFQYVLAMVLVTLIMAYFFWVSKPGFNNTNASEIKQILGTILGLIVGFYFGSSKSSADKDKTISDAMSQTKTTQP